MIYKEVSTKKEFCNLLEQVIAETKSLKVKNPSVSLYTSIYNQLIDIKEHVIVRGISFSRDQVKKRYNIGPLAVKNFDDNIDIYARKLEDIYGSIDEYKDYPL